MGYGHSCENVGSALGRAKCRLRSILPRRRGIQISSTTQVSNLILPSITDRILGQRVSMTREHTRLRVL